MQLLTRPPVVAIGAVNSTYSQIQSSAVLTEEIQMKHVIMFLAFLVLAAAVHAQGSKPATRAQMQHKYNTRYIRQHLGQTEGSLVQALNDSSVSMQTSALVTIRELEQVFPEYPFASWLLPLTNKLKDENTDVVVRRLAALALDGLHSEDGDAAIAVVAKSSDDKGLQILCNVLLLKGSLYK